MGARQLLRAMYPYGKSATNWIVGIKITKMVKPNAEAALSAVKRTQLKKKSTCNVGHTAVERKPTLIQVKQLKRDAEARQANPVQQAESAPMPIPLEIKSSLELKA